MSGVSKTPAAARPPRSRGGVRPLQTVLAAAAISLLATVVAQDTAVGACSEETMIERHSAVKDEAFDALFTSFGPGWTGGDSTYSVELPDGRNLWLFSDSFIGFVNPSRTRPRNTPMVNNSLVVQDGEELTTITGDIGGIPQSFFPTGDLGGWFWVYDATVETTEAGDVLRVFLIRFERTAAGGMWGFAWQDNALATVSLPDLELVSIEPLPSEHGVSWGAAVLEHGEHVYIYGMEDLGARKHMHLARAKAGAVADAASWEYATAPGGASWSGDPADSVRLLTGIGNEFSVTHLGGRFLLVTMSSLTTLSPEVVAYAACDPAGPFEDRTVLYETPEHEEGLAFTYNAHAHPQFTENGELLISYNVNASDIAWVFADADLYRPRFIRVRIGGP